MRCDAVCSRIFAGPVLRSVVALSRGCFQGLEDRWDGRFVRVFCGIEPATQRLSASFEVCHRLPANHDKRNALQVVMNRAAMVQRMDDTNKTRTYSIENSGLDAERFEDLLDLLDYFDDGRRQIMSYRKNQVTPRQAIPLTVLAKLVFM